MTATRLVDALRRVVTARRRWEPLPRVDIAIFDTHCGALLARVLEAYSCFSIDTRGESYHMPTLLAACCRWLLSRGRGSIARQYFSRLIRNLDARICITNQDSHHLFYDLDKMLPHVRFMAVQQGLKNEYSIGQFSQISGDYFAYGQAYADVLHNGKVRMHVCGSLKANMARLSEKKHPRVCFISGMSAHRPDLTVLKKITYGEFIYPVLYTSLREVDQFCSRQAIELVIASKAKSDVMDQEHHPVFKRESNTYENILGRTPPLVMGDSYTLAGDSELVVCDQSALGYELLGRGCKVVFINLVAYFHRERSYRFGWPLALPEQGPFWTSHYDPGLIQAMLEHVWGMALEEWQALIAPYQEQLMHSDPGNSIVLRHIRDVIGEKHAEGRDRG